MDKREILNEIRIAFKLSKELVTENQIEVVYTLKTQKGIPVDLAKKLYDFKNKETTISKQDYKDKSLLFGEQVEGIYIDTYFQKYNEKTDMFEKISFIDERDTITFELEIIDGEIYSPFEEDIFYPKFLKNLLKKF